MSQLTETIARLADRGPSAPLRIVARRPSARQWLGHAALFVVTAITTTISGIVWLAAPNIESPNATPPNSLIGYILYVPQYYLAAVAELLRQAFLHPTLLADGLVFSVSLLAILTAHECGHYVFCRYYGVDATLPFFIPQPPLLFPGTFGAFIRMKSPVPTRRALFDIGLAGPLAGFVVIVPVAFVGVLSVHHAPAVASESSGITFNDPLLFQLIAWVFRIDLEHSVANSFYMAAWVGLLVTALNLMPVGQLDGGHGSFAVFGQRAHWWIGRIAFVTMVFVAILGWLWHHSPSGFVYTVLLAVMLGVRHPRPQTMEPLGPARVAVGIITLIVFVLCFLPFPITLT